MILERRLGGTPASSAYTIYGPIGSRSILRPAGLITSEGQLPSLSRISMRLLLGSPGTRPVMRRPAVMAGGSIRLDIGIGGSWEDALMESLPATPARQHPSTPSRPARVRVAH